MTPKRNALLALWLGALLAMGTAADPPPCTPVPVAEVCDGRDNDGDGVVDEGCPFGDVTLTAMPQRLHFYPRDRATGRCTFTIEGELRGVPASSA